MTGLRARPRHPLSWWRVLRRGWVAPLLVAIALVPLPVTAAPAAAAPASVLTFQYTGGAQSWTVPENVSSATFDVYGAEGGGIPGIFSDTPGGFGGRATATLPVTAGATISIMVGWAGQPVRCATDPPSTPGGFNGGGLALASVERLFDECLGGSGGGGSDVRIGGTELQNRALVAGGGGSSGGTCGFFDPAVGGAGGGPRGVTACGQRGGLPGDQTGSWGNGDFGQGGQGAQPVELDTSPPSASPAGRRRWRVVRRRRRRQRLCPGQYGGGGGSGHGPAGTVFETGVRSGNGLITVTYSVDLPLPQLTLVKEVDHADTNGQRIPTDWTLSAVGPVSISGQTGTAAVTSVSVPVGKYALSETGPNGYTASAWSCYGGLVFDNVV